MNKPLHLCFAIALLSCTFSPIFSQWQLTGNSNATSASLLGTTNSISLRLATKNTPRIIIDTLGRVGIGITLPATQLMIRGSGGNPVATWTNIGKPVFSAFGETNVGNADFILGMASSAYFNAAPHFAGRRSRGTLDAPVQVNTGDQLMSFSAFGYDGTAFQNPASVDFIVDGNPSGTAVPTGISFATGSNGVNRAERLKISSAGDVTITAGKLITQNQAGLRGNIINGYALGVNAGSNIAGISVTDPVNNLIFSGTKSGTNNGVYLSKTSRTSTTPVVALEATGVAEGLESFSHSGYGAFTSSDSSCGLYAYSGSTYAGYFSGDVYTTGAYQTSDERLKKNIEPLANALDIISRLQPKSYEFKNEGSYGKLNLPKGNHYGLLAQDVEKITPSMVKDASINSKYLKAGITTEETKGEKVEFKAVNYNELIPVLIKAVQEQSAIVREQANTIKQQNEKLKGLCKQCKS